MLAAAFEDSVRASRWSILPSPQPPANRGAERSCYLRPSASGLALLHLPLGELGLLWIAEQLGYGGLDGLGGFTAGLPLVAQHSAGGSGLVVAGRIGHDAALVNQVLAFLLGGFAQLR